MLYNPLIQSPNTQNTFLDQRKWLKTFPKNILILLSRSNEVNGTIIGHNGHTISLHFTVAHWHLSKRGLKQDGHWAEVTPTNSTTIQKHQLGKAKYSLKLF